MVTSASVCVHAMMQSLGQLGRVQRLLNDGAAVVKVNGKRWAYDTKCLIPVRGAEPTDISKRNIS